MKSAYELAMERLEKEQGKVTPSTDKQKAALADIEQRMTAGQAELEILYRDKIAHAAAQGNYGDIAKLEADLIADKNKIRENAETEKDAVRRDASLA